jgi:hypothetical protein
MSVKSVTWWVNEKRVWARALRLLAVLPFLLTGYGAHTQSLNWQWATGPGGQCITSAVCADANGNAFTCGHFLGALTFGPDTLKDGLGPVQDVFIAKYNAAGQPLWQKNAIGYADANGVSTDVSENVYMVGNFYNDSLVFGSYVLVNPTPGMQVSNVFLAKYDSTGNLLWAKNLGGINNDNAAAIATDATGNIYITGTFIGDSLSIDNVTVQHLGTGDGFIAKLDTAGNALWIRTVGSAFVVGATGVCVDGNGNPIITGYFMGHGFYVDSLSNIITSAYSSNVFVIKYDALGNRRFTKYAGSNNGNGPGGVAADALGNIYITGYFSDTVTLDNDTVTGNGYQNIFTAKYDSTGVLEWVQGTGGTSVDQSTGIAVDVAGNAYITGYFQSDTISFENYELYSPVGNQITFVAKYDKLGNAHWAVAPGGNSNNTGVAICYGDESIYLTGNYAYAAIIFGNDTLSTSNVFLAKSDSTVLATGTKYLANSASPIIVYPNPCAGKCYLSGVSPGNSIEVFNLSGKCVYSTIADNTFATFNLGGKAKGVYLYTVTDKGFAVQQGKIVIQ